MLPAVGLLAFSLLWALGSLRADLLANLPHPVLPAFAGQAFPLALCALAAALLALARRAARPPVSAALLVALGLFVAPAWLIHLAAGAVPAFTRVVLFSLVPVFAVVLEPHLNPDAAPGRFSLAAALAALCGFLLVFPFHLPQSPADAAAFLAILLASASIAASNCIAVRVAGTLPSASFAAFAALTCALAATCLALSSELLAPADWRPSRLAPALLSAFLWSALVDLPALALLFWLFRRLSAVRTTTRFLLAPLFAALASALVLHPRIQLSSASGLLLIAAGAAWLLLAPAPPPENPASPLHLSRS
ncbi:MAG TPA: EamA family transporter [Terracidiphilus sp.]|nr:EamA family transporter [Terracidiphilus sp.]